MGEGEKDIQTFKWGRVTRKEPVIENEQGIYRIYILRNSYQIQNQFPQSNLFQSGS